METLIEEEHFGEDSWYEEEWNDIATYEDRREFIELKLKKIYVQAKIAYQEIDILKDFKCKLI